MTEKFVFVKKEKKTIKGKRPQLKSERGLLFTNANGAIKKFYTYATFALGKVNIECVRRFADRCRRRPVK